MLPGCFYVFNDFNGYAGRGFVAITPTPMRVAEKTFFIASHAYAVFVFNGCVAVKVVNLPCPYFFGKIVYATQTNNLVCFAYFFSLFYLAFYFCNCCHCVFVLK